MNHHSMGKNGKGIPECSIVLVLTLLLVPVPAALAGGIVTTDYFINHQGVE